MEILNSFDINIDLDKILVLLGYKDGSPDEEILQSIKEEIKKSQVYLKPQALFEKFYIKEKENSKVVLENSVVLEGEHIAEKLSKCQYVIVTAATLGHEIDGVIKSCFDDGDYLRGMIADSIGTCAIEYVNNTLWNRLLDDIKGTDTGITSRLSPGTGGWDMSGQKCVFSCINSEDIGISLTESNLMAPLKSTTTVYGFGEGIGITRAEHICSECNMKNCAYRIDNKLEVIIKYGQDTRALYVKRGSILLDILREEKIDIASACGGKGICGKCRVLVVKGAGKPSESDLKHLSKEEIAGGMRLSCTLKVHGSLEIMVPKVGGAMEVMTSGSEVDIELSPEVAKKHLVLSPPSLDDQRCDYKRVADGLNEKALVVSAGLLQVMPGVLRDSNFDVTACMYKNILLDIEKGDTSNKCYGTAVDIGTTTVACYLVDMLTGKVIDVESGVNSQRAYGPDVISRINFTMEQSSGLSILKDAVVSQINSMVLKLCRKNGIDKRHMNNMSIVGNTTMVHLLLGLPCANIALAPFIPSSTCAMEVHGQEIGIDINGYVNILPGVSGYIGSDITAGMVACGMADRKEYSLLLDLGTNGEMAIGNSDGIVCCSTAAGPAFEGTNIKWGVGGIKGAISKIDLSKEKIYETIGNDQPCGICGSGVLDMLSELLKYGIIDETGRMEDLEDLSCSDSIKSRIAVNGNMKEFIIDGDITFTQKDAREVQLAKAAISAGIKILMEEKKISSGDIKNVFVAGGFGNYMDIKSAVNIGLIPKELLPMCKSIGNSAGTGARMYLLSKKCKDDIKDIVSIAKYIELSGRSDFQDYFIDSMMLGG